MIMRNATEYNNRTGNNRIRNSRATACGHYTGKYGVLAVLMAAFFFGGLLMIEHMALVHLTLAVIFCTVSGAMLLYALMKMNVMEFQPGSFWYRVNQYVNREETAVRGRQAARSTVYAMIVHKS